MVSSAVSDSPLTGKQELFCKLRVKLSLDSILSRMSKKTLENPNADKNQDKLLVGIITTELQHFLLASSSLPFTSKLLCI